jgi:hypothetical protein
VSSNDIFFTIFTSDNCKLTKKHSLGQHRKLHTVPSAHMSSGKANTISTTLSELPSIIRGLNQNQCLGLGVWVDGLLEDKFEVDLTTSGKEKEGSVSRTLRHFKFMEGQPALMYIDVDGTDLSMEDAYKLLTSIDPKLDEAEFVATYSSSSHIYSAEGEVIRGGGSMHFFFVDSHRQIWESVG